MEPQRLDVVEDQRQTVRYGVDHLSQEEVGHSFHVVQRLLVAGAEDVSRISQPTIQVSTTVRSNKYNKRHLEDLAMLAKISATMESAQRIKDKAISHYVE